MSEDNFERFENRYVIRGRIRMETPLRIGKQIAPYSISSAPVLLQYDAERDEYVPFIPGSSLKGVLRSACERILRSFGEKVCEPPRTCDKCMVCTLFGSQEKGAKVRVRDCVFNRENVYWRFTEERPHHADIYKYNNFSRKYENKPNPRGYRTEEEILPFTFDLCIEMDNATDKEISFILLGLEEFNYKRAHIGGGVSRGLGVVVMEGINVRKKVLNDFEVKEEVCEVCSDDFSLTPMFVSDDSSEFNRYWRANDHTLNGCVVCEFSVRCMSDFILKGVDEKTVNVGGTPTIPGSVIKGFLRKNFIKKWNAGKIDNILRSTRKNGHRSRILISDAFSDDLEVHDRIPVGTQLRCWMVFDNMEEPDIKEIKEFLDQTEDITGNISAKGYQRWGERRFNKVKFSLKKAWKFCIDDFEYEVTSQLEAA